jgi:peptidyl-prolyl cis-trans isomerase D
MLQAIREKTSGWIAYVIIGLISIPFALWGINSYLGGGEQQPAAVVDGEEISAQQLDYAYGRYRERLASVFGGSLPSAFGDDDTLKEQVLSQVIEERVLLSFVEDQGFRVGDSELFASIQSMEIFQQDGKFNPDLYRNQLASTGYLPAQYEEELRRSQEMQQLSQAIRGTAFLVPAQQQAFQRLENQQRKLRVLTIANQPEDIDVSDAEIETYYNDQPGLFMKPARVKVDYIEINMDTVRASLEVSEDVARDRYDQFRDQLTTPEVRVASHILLTVAQDADDTERERVLNEINQVKMRLDQGEDFAALARELSQDPGSAADGGDLGDVERGMMVKPFETALFAMSPNEVSDPVQTQFGYHLIKLHGISGGETQSFDEARAQIEQEIRDELAENQIYDLAEGLSNITYEQPDSLLPAAEQLGISIKTSDWFTRDQGAGIAEEARVRVAAFSEDVLQQNRNSEAIELGENRVVVVHLNQYEESVRQPLEDVRDTIVQSIKARKGREAAQQRGSELLQALRGGDSLDQVATQVDGEINDPGSIGRRYQALSRDVVNAAFSMPKPAGMPVYQGISEAGGDYTLIELSAVESPEDTSTEQAQQSVSSLVSNIATYEYQAMIKALTSEADIVRTPVSELQ